MLDDRIKHAIEMNNINILLSWCMTDKLIYTRDMMDVIEDTFEWVLSDDETLCVTSIGLNDSIIIGEIVTIDVDSGELTTYNFSAKF